MRDGRAIEEQAFVKLRKPLAVYVAALAPAQGQEILYDAAKDPDTFLVHPGRFPDVTLRLSVRGSLATADQHHTLSHSGMDYLVEIIGRMMREPGVEVTLCNAFRASGRPVHCVLLNAATARARYVRARPEETLFELAERTGAAPYLILYLNPSVEELTTELDPVAYLVPSTYGKRVELALDAESHLLVRVRVWDWGGRLYEQLEFNELRVNPELCDEDFDPENPEYDF